MEVKSNHAHTDRSKSCQPNHAEDRQIILTSSTDDLSILAKSTPSGGPSSEGRYWVTQPAVVPESSKGLTLDRYLYGLETKTTAQREVSPKHAWLVLRSPGGPVVAVGGGYTTTEDQEDIPGVWEVGCPSNRGQGCGHCSGTFRPRVSPRPCPTLEGAQDGMETQEVLDWRRELIETSSSKPDLLFLLHSPEEKMPLGSRCPPPLTRGGALGGHHPFNPSR